MIPDDVEDDVKVDGPTAEEVRREVAYLAKLQREVIVRHYLQCGNSVVCGQTINGAINCGNNVGCGVSIKGDINCGGNIECKKIEGDVECQGNIIYK